MLRHLSGPSLLRVLAGVASKWHLLFWGFLDSALVGSLNPLKGFLRLTWSPSLPPQLPGSMAETTGLSYYGCLMTLGVLIFGTSSYPFKGSLPCLYWKLPIWPIHGSLA
eukprot:Gb_22155 [translate_table: standard]